VNDGVGEALREADRQRLAALVERNMDVADALHTDIYALRDGRWQVVWSQATRIRAGD
jgi:hypothetical protein